MAKPDLLTALAAEPEASWRTLTMAMSWKFRAPDDGRIVPPRLIALGVSAKITEADWAKLRKRVTTKRRNDAFAAKRRGDKERLENKRAYMRNYMRARREKEASDGNS